MNNQEKKDIIENCFKTILLTLGLDLQDPNLKDTPKRVSKMYVDEIFSGLDKTTFPKITVFPNEGENKYNQMVIVDNIRVNSVCSHHFQNIIGVCHVAYIPGDWVIGLSKIPRVVRFFSKKPQIQEQLTEEIYSSLCKVLKTEDVAVIIKAEHFCMKCRGIKEQNSQTTTSKMNGAFKQQETRAEFYNLLK